MVGIVNDDAGGSINTWKLGIRDETRGVGAHGRMIFPAVPEDPKREILQILRLHSVGNLARPLPVQCQDVATETPHQSRPTTLLDLGCAAGILSMPSGGFRHRSNITAWTSKSHPSRAHGHDRTQRSNTFPASNIPYDAGWSDIVFSHQVFEHVRHPEQLMRDIARALRPGGEFIGSVSQLEPYHLPVSGTSRSMALTHWSKQQV